MGVIIGAVLCLLFSFLCFSFVSLVLITKTITISIYVMQSSGCTKMFLGGFDLAFSFDFDEHILHVSFDFLTPTCVLFESDLLRLE